MKKVLNIKTGLILVNLGLLIMIVSLFLRINELQELVDVQGTQLIQCNEEVNALYGKYIKLEEENESLWDNYYMNVSDYKGEYYE